MTIDVDLNQLVKVVFLNHITTVRLLSTSSHTVLFRRKLLYAAHTSVLESYTPFIYGRTSIKFIWNDFLQKDLALLPHLLMYSINSLHQYGLMILILYFGF